MKQLYLLITVAASMFAALSCDQYEDGKPSDNVLSRFEKMYPNAYDIEWELEGIYWEVSFDTGSYPNVKEHTAWFKADGTWLRTETELHVSAVPDAIKQYLQASEYGSALLQDTEIDYVQTPEGNFYQFELLYNGVVIKVNVTPDGNVSVANAADYMFF